MSGEAERVVIHTDGACSGNPGPGGWGAILELNGQREGALAAASRETTNNRMELTAAIEALSSAEAALAWSSCTPIPNTCATASRKWIHGWKRNGWKTAARKPVKNVDLWQALDAQTATHEIDWRWVKGHAGHDLNERADELAREGMKPFLKARNRADCSSVGWARRAGRAPVPTRVSRFPTELLQDLRRGAGDRLAGLLLDASDVTTPSSTIMAKRLARVPMPVPSRRSRGPAFFDEIGVAVGDEADACLAAPLLGPGAHHPGVVGGEHDDLVDALGKDRVAVLQEAGQMVAMAGRREGAGHADQHDLAAGKDLVGA